MTLPKSTSPLRPGSGKQEKDFCLVAGRRILQIVHIYDVSIGTAIL